MAKLLDSPDSLLDLAGNIVVVALVSTILMRGTAAAQLVTALANGFAKSINAAQD